MSTTSEKLNSSQGILASPTLILCGMVWATLALLFFLVPNITQPGNEDLPMWYSIGTYVFGWIANLTAGILCLRNWRSSQIISGRTVWLALGIGMLSYFVGDLFFASWELIWNLEPDVSLGDVCYIISYIGLIWGMVLAVLSKRVDLRIGEWGILAAIAAVGVALAFWISVSPDGGAVEAASETAAIAASETVSSSAPAAILALDDLLSQYADYVGLLYVVLDVFLLIVPTALLLAFWGGRFSQSWQIIAAGTFSLYIADMWFRYADGRLESYQSGNLLEVFWVFTPILFGIAAVLEYHISTRPRQSRRKRRVAATES
ncbi:MAG: hypothetical protein F6J93_17210 [Oscillatoria sp. SIO1A7]|nr:hypothetical protein [Oscillatoria sp. SIO1A7]